MENNNIEKELIEIERNINGYTVVLKCESFLKDQGEWLLKLFEEEALELIKDDFKIQAGFTMFILKEKDGKLHVVAPDYRKNPFEDTNDNISLPLILQLQQNDILKKLEIEGDMIAFDDKVIILKDARDSENLYLERSKQYGKGDSGWYIGVIDESEGIPKAAKGELNAIPAFEILRFRPDLVKLLSLPKGYLVAIVNNEIQEIVDGDNRVAYKKMAQE